MFAHLPSFGKTPWFSIIIITLTYRSAVYLLSRYKVFRKADDARRSLKNELGRSTYIVFPDNTHEVRDAFVLSTSISSG